MKKSKILVLSSLSLAAILAVSSCNKKDDNNNTAIVNDSTSNIDSKTASLFSEQTIAYNNNLKKSGLFDTINSLTKSDEEILATDVDENTPKEVVDTLTSAGFSNAGLKKIAGYKSTYKKVTAGQSVNEITSWGTENNIIFPGSIVRVQDPLSGDSGISSYGVRSGNITISTNMYTSTGTTQGGVSKYIPEANVGSVRTAISDIVDKNLVDGSVHSCQITSSVQEIKNSTELSVVLGTANSSTSTNQTSSLFSTVAAFFTTRGKYGSSDSKLVTKNAKFSENTESDSGSSHYYACIQLTQVYYSIDLDLVYDPMEIITDNLTKEKLDILEARGGVPGVVSSVKYGRKAICILELDCSYSDYVSDLTNKKTESEYTDTDNLTQVNTNNLVSKAEANKNKGNADDSETKESYDESQKKSSTGHVLNSTCFIYGGDNASSLKAVQSTTASEIINAFASSVDPKNMVGCPISYTITALDGSNAPLKVGTFDTYYERELTPIEPEGVIAVDIDTLKNIERVHRGNEYTFTVNRTPIDALYFEDLSYSLKIDDENIKITPTTEKYNDEEVKVGYDVSYTKGEEVVHIASLKFVDKDTYTLKLENDDYLADKKIIFEAKYNNSKYSKYSFVQEIKVVSYKATILDANNNVVSTIVASKDDNGYYVNVPSSVSNQTVVLDADGNNVAGQKKYINSNVEYKLPEQAEINTPLGSKTFTYDDLKNINVNYELSQYKKEDYFPELNKSQLQLSDFLKDLNITVDYDNNTVTVNSIKGKEYSWYERSYGTDYYEDLTTLWVVEDKDESGYGDTTIYKNYTDYGTGWTYLLLDPSNQKIERNGSITVTDVSNVKLIISVCEHSSQSDAYSNDYWDYHQLVISLDLRK